MRRFLTSTRSTKREEKISQIAAHETALNYFLIFIVFCRYKHYVALFASCSIITPLFSLGSEFIFLILVRGIIFYLGPLCGNDSCYYRCCLCTPLYLARQKINVLLLFRHSSTQNFRALKFLSPLGASCKLVISLFVYHRNLINLCIRESDLLRTAIEDKPK
jgi:hypothetical protein